MFIATVVSEPNGNFMTANFSVFYFDSPFFKPYQLVTHMFMHGSIAHVFFNMFALASFGSLLERIWGPKRFLIFYFATGLGAILLHQLVMMYEVHHLTGAVQVYADGKLPNIERVFEIYGTPTVGASGAIYGIIIAFGMLFPNTELMLIFFPVPIKAKYLVPFMVLLELFLGVNNFQWDNIAHFAHLGGALFGFILIKIWQRNRKNFY
ncbi:MAG TPA: rhomboid family intramembrane serine protease [Flavobacteriales bacterium]|nr:rhomboid family intramembrane serine protease [Flavobacteriales bacterium]